jgi:hypothetical protein
MADFVVGANLPWLDYGLDFGANAWQPEGGLAGSDRRERLRAALDGLARSGATLVRWWLLADGRAGIRDGPSGQPLGLHGSVFDDLEVAIEALHDTGLRVMPVLTDFLWFARPRRVRGVRLGGRLASARDPALREALVERVLEPLFERYGREPAIAAWDLVNEPEWATLGLGSLDPRASLTQRQMRDFLRDVIGAARRHVRQPLTVGLASARWLDLVADLDLDFDQVHWYDTVDTPERLERPGGSLGRGRPLLLGEYPTRGASLSPQKILETARRSGYFGALAWSALASDPATDRSACMQTLAAWAGRHDASGPQRA